jgi:hypothetical protein
MTSIADRHVCTIATKYSTAALSACTTTVVCKLYDAEHEAKLKFVHLIPSGGVYVFGEIHPTLVLFSREFCFHSLDASRLTIIYISRH